MKNEKIISLASFLDVEPETIVKSEYDDDAFEIDGAEYLVLTDEEADKKAEECIIDSLWAFNTSFILNHSHNLRVNGWNERTEKAFQEMQSSLCESANEIVKAIIDDLDDFVSDAIAEDGRGHFISFYDGEENEQGDFYIYRTN
jgi:hypothetical protein